MKIIKNRKIQHTDWQLELPDNCSRMDSTPSPQLSAIVSLDCWMAWWSSTSGASAREMGTGWPGVFLTPDDDFRVLADFVNQVPVIGIEAGNFADGRIYSMAVEIREDLNYQGELRAVGATLDNLALLERCGFDAFELKCSEQLPEAGGYFDELEPVYRNLDLTGGVRDGLSRLTCD